MPQENHAYRNVMEDLVSEEVQRQIKALPKNVTTDER